MADRRIYAGYYRRYDGKVIYVVTMAKDADTDEDVVIWTPNVYSDKRAYYTMSKGSFCASVLIEGMRQPKFKRQTQMRITASAVENFEEDGFVRPVRKTNAHTEDGYDDWRRPSADTYHEYAKQVCEGYRFSRAKYALCVKEKRYIGISREDFHELKSDLLFLQNCLRTVLSDYASYFEERFVNLYLICRKSLKHGAGEMNCAVISKAVGLCEKTVRTHLHTLADTGFIKAEYHGRTFSYSLCPIQGKAREPRSATPRSRWRSTKQAWLTGEVFNAVFPIPVEVFQLGLKAGELLMYIYLHYQKGVRSSQCWPSYATIGAAVGMGRKTVQKHVRALIDKGLIQVEDTMVRRKNGRSYNGSLLYTVKPIEQILKEREEEFLAELKLAETQRKWDRRCQQRDRPCSAL